MTAARFLVSGKVQGVWFRASARDQAVALGLRGFARNLPDGRRGSARHRRRRRGGSSLAQWLHYGPPQARVDDLERWTP